MTVVIFSMIGSLGQRRKPLRIARFSGEYSGKLAQKSKQQKTHTLLQSVLGVSSTLHVSRLANPISCIFSVGGVHHESVHGRVQNFSFSTRKLFCFHFPSENGLSGPFCSRKAHECFPPENFTFCQPCGLKDSFGNPATHLPRKKHPGGVFTVWLGPGMHTSANFLAASEGHIFLGPTRKVALNPGYGFFGRLCRPTFDIYHLGEGKWGCQKCRRIPKREGDWQGRVPSVLFPEKLFKTKDLELPIFAGSLPSCSPHFAGYIPLYTCTSPWPIMSNGSWCLNI